MNTKRKIYDKLPERIDIPKSMKDHRVEVLFIDLDDQSTQVAAEEKRAWPTDFFDRTFGAIPDLPEREP